MHVSLKGWVCIRRLQQFALTSVTREYKYSRQVLFIEMFDFMWTETRTKVDYV